TLLWTSTCGRYTQAGGRGPTALIRQSAWEMTYAASTLGRGISSTTVPTACPINQATPMPTTPVPVIGMLRPMVMADVANVDVTNIPVLPAALATEPRMQFAPTKTPDPHSTCSSLAPMEA